MKEIDRLTSIKENLYYVLGIVLIAGFVSLYWPHFRNIPGAPAAQSYLMNYFGDKTAMGMRI